jgi:hypothetical protein
LITKRDQDIYNFLDKKENGGIGFHHASTSQINRLFFCGTSDRYCRKRLQYLYEIGYLKRTRSTLGNDFAYYIEKKSLLQQVHHDLIRTEIYTVLNSRYKILEWHNEFSIDHIRPDAFCYIDNGYPVFIEVHLSNNFNFDKYIEFARQDLKVMFGVLPRVIICTDRQVTVPKDMYLKFKVVNFDMAGIDSLFK